MTLLGPNQRELDSIIQNWSSKFDAERLGCASHSINEDLPPGFPPRLTSSLAWTGSDLRDELNYIYHLSENDKVEIDNALLAFKGTNCRSISRPDANSHVTWS
jgi:hypothetical protein